MSSRRNLLGAVADAAVASAAVASPANADAELIRLATEHEALGRIFNADFPEVDDDDHPLAVAAQERRNRNAEQRDKLLAQMRKRPPTTLAGLRAVAAALVVEDVEFLKPRYMHDDSDRLMMLLVRGLVDERGAA